MTTCGCSYTRPSRGNYAKPNTTVNVTKMVTTVTSGDQKQRQGSICVTIIVRLEYLETGLLTTDVKAHHVCTADSYSMTKQHLFMHYAVCLSYDCIIRSFEIWSKKKNAQSFYKIQLKSTLIGRPQTKTKNILRRFVMHLDFNALVRGHHVSEAERW